MKFIKSLFAISVLSLLILGDSANAQVNVYRHYNALQEGTVFVSPKQTTNVVTNLTVLRKLEIKRGSGLGISAYGATTNATVGDATISIDLLVTQDGVNYTTKGVASLDLLSTGTTPFLVFSNIPPSVLDNAKYFKLQVRNPSTNTVWFTNIYISQFYTP